MTDADPARGGLARLGTMVAGAALVLLIAGALVVWWLWAGPGPAARDGEETLVQLRRGAGVAEIGRTLEREGVVGSAALFRAAVRLNGGDRSIRAGEYVFPSRASLAQVLDILQSGKVVRHFVTVPEGRSAVQVVDILMASEVLTGEVEVPPEGSVLPETYEVTRGETRAAVLQRMRDAHDEVLAELWKGRRADLPVQTPYQAVILASIVEKETGVADERPRVAAVFVNRMRKGMRLESDPTIIYPITKGRPLGRPIRRSEIDTVTPYNTYRVDGLPPTPIANPGRESLAAVLNPPDTEDLFFVADGTGGHVFSRTYAEHQAAHARWRQIRAERRAAELAAGN